MSRYQRTVRSGCAGEERSTMKEMKTYISLVAAGLAIFLSLVLFNQFAQIYTSAAAIHPYFGYFVLACLLIIIGVCIIYPVVQLLRLPKIILQGTATLALAARELIKREAESQPLRLKEIYCRFSGMVFPGSDITLQVYGALAGQKSGRSYFDVLNQMGEKVLSHGYALISPP